MELILFTHYRNNEVIFYKTFLILEKMLLLKEIEVGGKVCLAIFIN